MQVHVAWSVTILLCIKNGSPSIIEVQRGGAIRVRMVCDVHSSSGDVTESFTHSVRVV